MLLLTSAISLLTARADKLLALRSSGSIVRDVRSPVLFPALVFLHLTLLLHIVIKICAVPIRVVVRKQLTERANRWLRNGLRRPEDVGSIINVARWEVGGNV